jgi:hypothetical protein
VKIEVIDNFLTSYHRDSYANMFGGMTNEGAALFPWYFINNLNGEERLGNFYFNYTLIESFRVYNQEGLHFFNPILSKLNVSIDRVSRLKVNLYPWTSRRIHHKSHSDYDPGQNLTTCLYYVNTSNRVTIFDGKKKIRCKGNRAIIFDGSIKHHSTTPTDTNYGISINIDYREKDL